MGKFIRGFFCFLLCIILTASLVASVCVLGLTQMLEEENIDDILKNVSTGEKVLGYEKAESDEELSFGDALREYFPPQNLSKLYIFGDVASELTYAGIQGVVDCIGSDNVITDFSKLSDAFVEAYIAKGKETGVLSGRVRYYGVEKETKEYYARQAVPGWAETNLKQLAEEGKISGRLSLNGKDVILYTVSAGKKAADIENSVYSSLETRYDLMYREYLKGLVYYVLRGEEGAGSKDYDITEEEITDMFITSAKDSGVGEEYLESPEVKEEISKQINSYVLPRMRRVISEPYSTWVDDGIMSVMKTVRPFLEMDVRIPLGILCGGLLFLMILIGGKMGFGFGCISALLASLVLMAAPFYRQRSLDQLYRDLPQEIQDLGITETVADQILGFMSRYGLYCLAVAGVLLVLRLIAQLTANKKSEA